MAKQRSGYGMLLGCSVLALLGCTESDRHPSDSVGEFAPPSPVYHTVGPIGRSWSAVPFQVPEDADFRLLVTTHRALELWRVAADFSAEKLAAYPDAGYHPDHIVLMPESSPEHLRFVVAGEGSSTVQQWSYRDGQLQQDRQWTVRHAPLTVQAADLDGSGVTDIVVGPYGGNELTVLWQASDATVDEYFIQAAIIPAYPVVADWDGDGRPDILWSDWKAGTVRWARNLGERAFATEIIFTVEADQRPRAVAVGDVNGDGINDLVIVTELGPGAYVLFGDGSGGIETTAVIPGTGWGYISAAVLADGTVLLGEDQRVVLARYASDGDWSVRQLPAAGMPRDFHWVDINHNGIDDLVFANSSGNKVSIIPGPIWEQALPLELEQ